MHWPGGRSTQQWLWDAPFLRSPCMAGALTWRQPYFVCPMYTNQQAFWFQGSSFLVATLWGFCSWNSFNSILNEGRLQGHSSWGTRKAITHCQVWQSRERQIFNAVFSQPCWVGYKKPKVFAIPPLGIRPLFSALYIYTIRGRQMGKDQNGTAF